MSIKLALESIDAKIGAYRVWLDIDDRQNSIIHYRSAINSDSMCLM